MYVLVYYLCSFTLHASFKTHITMPDLLYTYEQSVCLLAFVGANRTSLGRVASPSCQNRSIRRESCDHASSADNAVPCATCHVCAYSIFCIVCWPSTLIVSVWTVKTRHIDDIRCAWSNIIWNGDTYETGHKYSGPSDCLLKSAQQLCLYS